MKVKWCLMKLATFNANSIRKRQESILAWLKEQKPDILCVQETKVQDHEFPREPFEQAGYHGPQEVEIFSAQNWWRRPGEEVLATCIERFRTVC